MKKIIIIILMNLSFSLAYSQYTGGINDGYSSGKKQVQPIFAPVLLLPENNATHQPANPFFRWEAAYDATSYTLQISTSNIFEELIINKTVYETSEFLEYDLEYGTFYYWRVNASDGTDTSIWSDVYEFKTVTNMSVEYNNFNNFFKIYPNPANTELFVEFSNEKFVKANIRILNIFGVQVLSLSYELENGIFKQKIELKDLVPGYYIFILKLDNINYYSSFIKNQ